MTAWALVAATIACSLPFGYVAIARPELRSLAFRTTVQRRGQSLLVLSGVVIATAVMTSAAVVGDSLARVAPAVGGHAARSG